MKDNGHKPYTAERWNEPIKPISIGPVEEFTPEEKAQNDRDMEHIMREYGVLGSDEKIENGSVIKTNTVKK